MVILLRYKFDCCNIDVAAPSLTSSLLLSSHQWADSFPSRSRRWPFQCPFREFLTHRYINILGSVSGQWCSCVDNIATTLFLCQHWLNLVAHVCSAVFKSSCILNFSVLCIILLALSTSVISSPNSPTCHLWSWRRRFWKCMASMCRCRWSFVPFNGRDTPWK